MPNQPDINKRQVGIRVPIELCRKVEVKYMHPEDNNKTAVAFLRALEDATRNVELTVEDYEVIAAEVRRNKGKR